MVKNTIHDDLMSGWVARRMGRLAAKHPYGCSRDQGSASIAVLGVVSMGVSCLGFVILAGVVGAGQSRADGFADRAALAAADAASGRLTGWSPCAAAEQALARSPATLVSCQVHQADPTAREIVGTSAAVVTISVEYFQDTPWGVWQHRSWATAG